MSRVILHCDCNSFFASVETVLEPSYAGVPMAVCGSVEDRHGIVLAKNELAKRYGITTAETVVSAKRKCPSLVIARPHYEEYIKYSRMVNAIYARYTDMIEPFGIDESWLDVTASRTLFGDGMTIAERIRREVKEECGITVSIGVSFNKIFAKLGSDYKKPDAITEISEENFRQIVYPLPARDLLFVGRRTADILSRLGIRTIGELAEASEELLTRQLGRMGPMLLSYARGEDRSPVQADNEPAKSISNGYTFSRDLTKAEECRQAIEFLTEEIGTKLRRRGLRAHTVTLKVKDTFLKTHQKQCALPSPTDTSREIAQCAFSLFSSMWQSGEPVRMLTVGVTQLTDASLGAEQLSLFDDGGTERQHRKSDRRERAMDEIRERFGTASILSASMIRNDFGLSTPKREEKHAPRKNEKTP